MKLSKITTGVILLAVAYFGMFDPSVFEFLEDIISFQHIQGLFFVFLILGIIGFSTLMQGINGE